MELAFIPSRHSIDVAQPPLLTYQRRTQKASSPLPKASRDSEPPPPTSHTMDVHPRHLLITLRIGICYTHNPYPIYNFELLPSFSIILIF